MGTTPTREELKAILDKWIPKYIRQVVELRSGSRLSAERYNELMNLLITQGDDTIELADTVKRYVEILVEGMETEFEVTTDTITDLANTAISTANSAANTVAEYKTIINRDITSFKEAVNQVANTANSNASLALQTANQLVIDMEGYRTALSTQVEETFINMRNALGVQITNEVEVQMQGIQEALTTDINNTINTLSEEVLTIANTAEQVVNSAVQDIDAYKADMDVRLDEALREVEESLSAAGEVIKDASVIYAAINNKVDVATVDNIINGTTTVGNANKLDGKSASAYKKTVVEVTETTANLNSYTSDGVYYFGTSTTLTNAPGTTGWLEVTHLDGASSLTQRWVDRNSSANEYIRVRNGSSWSEWKRTFTSSGGTVTDNITVDKQASSLVSTAVEVKNTGGRIQLIASSGGNLGLYDPANSAWIIKKGTDGKVFIDGDNTPLHTGNSAKVATSGKYSDLSGTPTIPTKTSQLTNDSGYKTTDTNTWRPLGTTADTACAGNDSRLSNSRPASDVYAWAKASSKPSYTKSEVGLGNVDNTADSAKSVKYATSAGSAPASDVYAWAKASSKPSYSWNEITSKPTSFAPTSHTHTASQITGTVPVTISSSQPSSGLWVVP